MEEIWKMIYVKNEETVYEISNKGRVRNINSGLILSQRYDKGGYVTVNIHINNRSRSKTVHRLVANAFIYNDDPAVKDTVNHKNYDKDDNYIDNLEWMSNSDNVKDMYNKGRHKTLKGEEVGTNKYKEHQIRKVCELLEDGFSDGEILLKTGVPKNIIGFIKRGTIWKHISSSYKIDKPKKKCVFEDLYEDIDRLLEKDYNWREIRDKLGLEQSKTNRELVRRRKNKLNKREGFNDYRKDSVFIDLCDVYTLPEVYLRIVS